MSKTAPIGLVAVVLFVPVSLFAVGQSQKDTPLHHFQLPCDNCHATQSSDSLQHQATTNAGQLTANINKLCGSSGCHNFDHLLSHPVGIRPKGAIPADMPLDNLSRITCLTCHDEPKSSDNSNYADGDRRRFLRRPEGMHFCSTCHTKMSGTSRERSHWQFSTRAHLSSETAGSVSTQSYQRFNGGIDPESRMCLSCHENVSVSIPAYNETPQQRNFRWKSMTDHPIGMDYEHTALRKIGKYHFPLMNDLRIRLFDGRVGCGSCHSLYANNRFYLVARKQGGVLCLQCHIK